MDRQSSELLGFAPDARVLIVNCDDFGVHDAVNAAVVKSIENGIASSCSLMVPYPAAADAMRLLGERPHIPFGIHLALIRDWPEYGWGPAAAKAEVPSLLEPDTGELYVDTPGQRTALLAEARLTDVEGELRAQIDAVVDAGLAPPPRLALSRRRRPRRHPRPGDGARRNTASLHGSGSRMAAAKLASRANPSSTTPSWTATPSASTTRRQPTRECSTIYRQASTNGPSIRRTASNNQSQTIEPIGWQIRQSDHALLTSPEAREILDHESITVIDYRPLQQAWNT